ncbi:MAG: pyrroline-5-carboxylate reductase, partial [Pseudomonadota bacterium]
MVLLGCGKMGSALLEGWLRDGVDPARVTVIEPYPSAWLEKAGVRLNEALPDAADVVLIAVKPQMMDDALPSVAGLKGALFLSIAAGVSLATFQAALGETPIVRAMPNTPAAVGQGITALIATASTDASARAMASTLMRAVGDVLWLETEDQMDAVTGVSGSGPAYVFHMIEALAAAGVAEGLPEPLAVKLAQATVTGAGALAAQSQDSAA